MVKRDTVIQGAERGQGSATPATRAPGPGGGSVASGLKSKLGTLVACEKQPKDIGGTTGQSNTINDTVPIQPRYSSNATS